MSKKLLSILTSLFLLLSTTSYANINTHNHIPLDSINSDLNTTTLITKDLITANLSIDASIDNRIFSSSGRSEIGKELKDVTKNILEVAKHVSNMPNTAIGATIGFARVLAGAEYKIDREKGIIYFKVPAEELKEGETKGSGLAIGNAINYFGIYGPNIGGRPYADMVEGNDENLNRNKKDIVLIEAHEMEHVYQSRNSGIFYLPSYLIKGGISGENEMEQKANAVGVSAYNERLNDGWEEIVKEKIKYKGEDGKTVIVKKLTELKKEGENGK